MHEQIIYFGVPGTGKSFFIQEKLKTVEKNKIFRVTFHPEYTYSDFIGQLLPDNSDGTVKFNFKEGPFTRALIEAYSNYSENVYLVLEEISRGNVAAIFGDIFQLLDRDEHFNSRYHINNKDIADKIVTLNSENIKLPSNFNIMCTVNMNDQNVFPMDTAFKRRFEWQYISTKPIKDSSSGSYNTKLNNPKLKIAIDSFRQNDIETNWLSFYMILNLFITNKEKGLGKNEDKQLGQFFIDFESSLVENSYSLDADLAEKAKTEIEVKLKNKLLLYLWQDVQGTSFFKGKTSLFDKTINSYDDLYDKFSTDKIFSEEFIEKFLIPNKDMYLY